MITTAPYKGAITTLQERNGWTLETRGQNQTERPAMTERTALLQTLAQQEFAEGLQGTVHI